MKVLSTGLGKTVMLAQFKELFQTNFDNQQALQITMEATEPLHWTIKVYMEPKDLRRAIVMGLKPSVLWKALLALILGRFSLFKKSKPGLEESSTEMKTRPVESADTSATTQSSNTPSPLASFKDATDNDEAPSPLAKLKG
jgi:hypothetical protein